jgi:fucose 4-O-acetylase-like acetyltransferase
MTGGLRCVDWRWSSARIGKDGELSGRRIAWLDLARGIGVTLVVAGHAERGLVAAMIATGDGWHRFDLALYTFHMPLFMVLAGLNVAGSLQRGRGAFLRGKLWTIAWPYVLWSLVQGVLLVELSGMTNSHADWSGLAMIAWRPISPFWFLYALMVYMTVVAVTGCDARVLVPLAAAGMIASHFLDGDTIDHQLCYQAGFFVCGVLATYRIRALGRRSALALLLPAIALWCVAFAVMPLSGETPYLKPAALPAACAGIAAVLALSRLLAQTVVAPLFVRLGQASMTIYVMHILGTAGARTALIRLHVPEAPALYWIVCTLVGVALPLLAHDLLARADLLPLFGLAARKRRGPLRPPAVIIMAPVRSRVS